MKTILLIVCLSLSACASKAPPTLEPGALPIWQANEVQLAFGTLQRTAIGLNGIQRCDPGPCHPLLSDANTRLVIDGTADVVLTLRSVPSGWKATAMAAVDRITQRLDAAGQAKLSTYLRAITALVEAL